MTTYQGDQNTNDVTELRAISSANSRRQSGRDSNDDPLGSLRSPLRLETGNSRRFGRPSDSRSANSDRTRHGRNSSDLEPRFSRPSRTPEHGHNREGGSNGRHFNSSSIGSNDARHKLMRHSAKERLGGEKLVHEKDSPSNTKERDNGSDFKTSNCFKPLDWGSQVEMEEAQASNNCKMTWSIESESDWPRLNVDGKYGESSSSKDEKREEGPSSTMTPTRNRPPGISREMTERLCRSAGSERFVKKLETDQQVLERRQKQLEYGRSTPEYARYVKMVPRHMRTRHHPFTPEKNVSYSRRAWDTMVKLWRKQLHYYDPEQAKQNLFRKSSTNEENVEKYPVKMGKAFEDVTNTDKKTVEKVTENETKSVTSNSDDIVTNSVDDESVGYNDLINNENLAILDVDDDVVDMANMSIDDSAKDPDSDNLNTVGASDEPEKVESNGKANAFTEIVVFDKDQPLQALSGEAEDDDIDLYGDL